jgi:hypothetical protein
MQSVIKVCQYIVELVEAAKKAYADWRMKSANEKAAAGDQRELDKVVDGSEPGPTKLHYDGLLVRTDKKPDQT